MSSSTTNWPPRDDQAAAGQTRAETRITANAKGYASLLFMATRLSSWRLGTRTRERMQRLEVAPENTSLAFRSLANHEVRAGIPGNIAGGSGQGNGPTGQYRIPDPQDVSRGNRPFEVLELD